MKWYVTLIAPGVPAGGTAAEDVSQAIPHSMFASALYFGDKNHSEITVKVDAATIRQALALAEEHTEPAFHILGTQPDAAEIRSEREEVHRLGGPEELAKMQRWLDEGTGVH